MNDSRHRGAFFEGAEQLHLEERVVLAARLCVLRARARAEKAEKDFHPERFTGYADSSLDEIIEEQISTALLPPLDGILDDFRKRLRKRLSDSKQMDAALSELDASLKPINCESCAGQPKRKCEGSFRDKKLFVDADPARQGGQCVSFVRRIIERVAVIAEDLIDKLVPELERRAGPRAVRIKMDGVGPCHDGTLPVDGQFEWDGESEEAVVTIKWPKARESYADIDRSILILLYLVFHEVFVHGGQGRAADRPIGQIDNDCTFTEGLVDGAARDLLLKFILANPKWLPDELQHLHDDIGTACESYHNQRKEKPGPATTQHQRTKEYILKEARAEGWQMFMQMQKISNHCKMPLVGDDGAVCLDEAAQQWQDAQRLGFCGPTSRWWVERCICQMNLQFDLDQREEFAALMQGVRSDNFGELQAIFSEYLVHRDAAKLLSSIEKALGFR